MSVTREEYEWIDKVQEKTTDKVGSCCSSLLTGASQIRHAALQFGTIVRLKRCSGPHWEGALNFFP